MEPICYIVGACPPGEIYLAPGRPAFLMAADRGLVHLEAQGMTPDLIVGDFDSLGRVPAGDNIIRHPVEKDDTDAMLAVKTGLERGFRAFVLYGCLGGRLDHTYANLQTLTYLARRGGQGWLLGEGTVVTAVRNGHLELPASLEGAVSVFCPDGEARGVTLRGLHYPLEGYTLTSGFPLGVSNQFTGCPASVSVREGTLLVMWEEIPERVLMRI